MSGSREVPEGPGEIPNCAFQPINGSGISEQDPTTVKFFVKKGQLIQRAAGKRHIWLHILGAKLLEPEQTENVGKI